MELIDFKKARFLLSVAKPEQLPKDEGAEVAFVGRSNVGKSSALNLLTQQSGLARVSNTPGRTQLINFFPINDKMRLVDLPGYGYAKVSKSDRQAWHDLIEYYLSHRKSLRSVILLMDSRHPLQVLDEQMICWAMTLSLPLHILLTKSDKLTNSEKIKTLKEIRATLSHMDKSITVQLFSATDRTGLEELESHVRQRFVSPIK